MTRSADVFLSYNENRFLGECVERRIADFQSGPIADTFTAIQTKLHRRRRGAVRLTDPEIGELVWLFGMVIHHDSPADELRALKRALAKLRVAVLTEDWPSSHGVRAGNKQPDYCTA
jgi:hypothetical protein